MVILSACSTIWTAGAFHPCWGVPTGYGLRGERSRSMGYMPPSDLSQLNRWLLKRRRASVQRLTATAPIRRCWTPAVLLVSVDRDELPHPDELSRCVVLLLMRAAISLSYDG
jgi:hypothetical protein